MKELSYKNIKAVLETFASDHAMIQTIHRGSLYEVDELKKTNGIYMIWQPPFNSPDSSAVGNVRGQIYTMDIVFCDQVDRVNHADENVDDVLNETNLAAKDLAATFLKWNQIDYTDKDVTVILANWNIEHFVERFGSLYAGCVLSLTIKSRLNLNRCNIPVNNDVPRDGIGYWVIGSTFIVQ